ncbi:MAG: DNA-binding response regulator [Bacteroidetes bacterium]|nr:MAG: DNA-binding response regulator [Bacteroidota bacterium]
MGKNVRILIVEDEFVTLDLLRDYLEESGYEVSGDAMSAEEAIAILEKGETDFAMLDINIRGKENGIWIAEQINKKYRIPFIFLTALSDSGTVKTAARTNPYGYLVKPFKQADIFTTIEVALNNYNESKTGLRTADSGKKTSDMQISDAIFIKNKDVFKKILIKDIQYIEAFKNYLELYFVDSRQIIRSTLADFQKALPQDHFIQTHRSFIVNINFLERVGNDFVGIGNTEVPISRGFKESVLKLLKMYS